MHTHVHAIHALMLSGTQNTFHFSKAPTNNAILHKNKLHVTEVDSTYLLEWPAGAGAADWTETLGLVDQRCQVADLQV